jgi:hypothetical protein
MSKRQKQKEIQELKTKERKLEAALGLAVVKLEELNDLNKAAQSGPPGTEKREEIDRITKEIKATREKIKKRKGWIGVVRRNLRRKQAQLRNSVKPKIIDLNLDFRPMESQGEVNKVIGHYTAGPRDEDTKDAIRLCKLYHQSHLDKGWSGEAYMLCFTSDGNILLLRPSRYVGAHTLGYNTGSYGIMMHGTTGDRPTKAQKKALRWWAKNGHKAALGKCRTQHPPISLPWYGHNDFNPTSCPGLFKETYKSKGRI